MHYASTLSFAVAVASCLASVSSAAGVISSDKSGNLRTGQTPLDSNVFKVQKLVREEDINAVWVHPNDWKARSPYGQMNGNCLVTVKLSNSVPLGTVSVSGPDRKWCNLAFDDQVSIVPFNAQPLSDLKVEISLVKDTKEVTIDEVQLVTELKTSMDGFVMSANQSFVFFINDLKMIAKAVETKPNKNPFIGGIVCDNTIISYTIKSNNIQITGSSQPAAGPIVDATFDLSSLGVGGLDKQLSTIFRRAFSTRALPADIIKNTGTTHVKGLLLYGPPGTGKTLIARKIGQLLRARPPKIVNGPEILGKYVGQSEENIRKLFADAIAEQKEKGDKSQLHIIIMDELDSICRQRGTGGESNVGDSVVNQLLSMMDGVNQLNNILVIGMTNRKDMIDEALLRPGRFEVHIEIGLPDLEGRIQIFNFKTQHMRETKLLSDDVNPHVLAEKMENFSGAEIEALVKSAISLATSSYIKVGTVAEYDKSIHSMQVHQADFERALALGDVKPAFGQSLALFENYAQNGIIEYSIAMSGALMDGMKNVEQARSAKRTPLVSLLVHGLPESGTSSFAAHLALKSKFPFVKLIAADQMIGMNENSKMSLIKRVFDDAYRSELSVIVIDSIERLIEYVPLGPLFTNRVMQTVMVLAKKEPPKGHRLLVLLTTSLPMERLELLGINAAFHHSVSVPCIDSVPALLNVFESLNAFPDKQTIDAIESKLDMDRIELGIKEVIYGLEQMQPETADEAIFMVINLQKQHDERVMRLYRRA